MALMAVTVCDDGLILRCGGALDTPLHAALDALPRGAPVVLMLHGYRHSPFVPAHDPHGHILAAQPEQACWKALPWPTRLNLADPGAHGLAIGVGWHARGSLAAAYDRAGLTGAALARLVAAIRHHHDGPVRVIAHSLGARVALQALATLPKGAIDRAVFLAAAEFQGPAQSVRDERPDCEIINVTSRENDLFDFLIERWLGARPGSALGHGLGRTDARWRNLPLDDPATLRALAQLGVHVAPPGRRVCHWSLYMRHGAFDLYRALLTDPAPLPLRALDRAMPQAPAPRWSRLFARPGWRAPLPSAARLSP